MYLWRLRQLPEYVNQSDLSRAAIFNTVNASLARLETPYIDDPPLRPFDNTRGDYEGPPRPGGERQR
ncbi:hypothetical protein AZE42_07407 [Rhizopogon vesiculosus]|uniref:Uncharacterized protein n=1 Tax=Rhizopogon vesiculosus TaxID=180088 RepID=A0A1J8QKR1_9AGAM|nr:hypothetical protein AZE42_07407 [Rhizopogon vesiculosus]